MIHEGKMWFKVKGTLKEVAEKVVENKKDGWRVDKIKRRIDWPCFWRYKYTIKLVKDCIIDGDHVIETPLTELK